MALPDLRRIHQWCLQPTPEAAAAHGGEAAIDGPEQGALQLVVPLGGSELQVAPRLGVKHQHLASLQDLGDIQRHPGLSVERLGVVEIGQEAANGPQSKGEFLQPKAIEAGEPVVVG